MSARVVVVAGASSGAGKTSVTLGLLASLRRRGVTVQAFKVGPDFIDPGLHAVVTGRPSYNLDGWMCGRELVLQTVARAAGDADVAVVEGVMGCFDGVDGMSDEGSTAQVAKWLAAPVILVIDAAAMARSLAAVALGFERFDPGLRVAGVIANRVGGAGHARWIAEALRGVCRAEPLGAIAYDPALTIPERHLGLHTAGEGALGPERVAALADAVERGIDVGRLLELASPLPPGRAVVETAPRASRARIGVARDAAFQFYYAENLEALRAAGAELVWWSPLADADLPEVDGLYLGGGYPELYAGVLADNGAIRKALRRFADRGRPVYAECGGLMFLADSLEDREGRAHPMVGLLPAAVRMRAHGLTIDYAEVELTQACPLGGVGAIARGHEFHASILGPVPAWVDRAYRARPRSGAERPEGYLVGRALMSYFHLHFASSPGLAAAFVDACAEGR